MAASKASMRNVRFFIDSLSSVEIESAVMLYLLRQSTLVGTSGLGYPLLLCQDSRSYP